MSRRRVVITGVGAVTPLGVGALTLLQRWMEGECGIEDGRGACADFDPALRMRPKEIRRTDRFAQLAVAAADEAVEQAGWGPEPPYPGERVGCVLGSGIGGIGTLEESAFTLAEHGPERTMVIAKPLGIAMTMANAGAATLAMRYGLQGPSFCTVTACAAGAHAIGAAVRMIQNGEADAVVTGGAEAPLCSLGFLGFEIMRATSPTGVSRPFDARRDGFVMGEGAGVLILEEAECARARGATPLGEILGYGASTDAHHLTDPKPDGGAAARAMRLALEDAGVAPSQVDYVNAHGTATQLNDRIETQAIKTALGPYAMDVPVSSTKSAVGHLLGASGAVEAVVTLLALRERMAPPTLGYEEPEEGLDLDYVPGEPRPLAVRYNGRRHPSVGLSNSFGFGGHNAVLCLRAAE